jgi:hypothetical protein
MEQHAQQDASLTAVMERALRPLMGCSAPPAAGARTMTSGPVLSWGAIALGREGALPEATVTWPGHRHATVIQAASATRTVNGGPADGGPADGGPEDGGPEDGGAGVPVSGDEPVDNDEPVGADGLVGCDELVGGAASPVALDQLPVGAGLVDVLAGVEVADLADDVLLDVGARWQEVISWATAMQSRALGELARRRSWTEEHNAAAAEISARLRIPQGEANKHLARGAGLAEHSQVMNALHAGLIDTAKADILLRSGNPLTLEERDEAIARYLPQAPDRTREWLRNKMNEFAHRLKGAVETTKRAMARRAVYLDPADNAMAWISANLPASDAAAVWDSIEQAAHTLRRTPGGTRTLAQARADALVAITTGRIIVPPRPECALADAATTTTTATTVTDPTVTDPTATPKTTGSAGGAAGHVAAGASVPQTSPEVTFPRTTVPAAGCTCGGCTCGGTAIRVIQVKPQVRVTIPATALLGLDNAPGHLEGYGPVPADIAAQIATDATWRRLITDPTTGILTDYSSTTYQPGKILRQAVTARDRTCSFPQCERPARWADLDHIEPFDHDVDPANQPPGSPSAPGQTRATNLQPLCRAHHLAKTHHGWTPVRDPATGTTTWTAPTGHTYTRQATQTGQTNQTGQAGRERQVGQVSNDITSLTEDTRARLGQPPLNQRPLNQQANNAEPTAAESTTADRTTAGSTAAGSAAAASALAGSTAAGLTTDAEQSLAEPPTTEQRLRRYPDEPPF